MKHQKLPPLPQSPINDSKVNNSLLTGSKAPLNQGEQSPKSPKKKKKFVHELKEQIELIKFQNLSIKPFSIECSVSGKGFRFFSAGVPLNFSFSC